MACNVFPESFFLALLSLNFLLSLITSSYAQMVPAVFVFGDSLVDVGNNNHLTISLTKANFPHNGIDFPSKKATGRFTNGKNAADFLAEKLGLPSSPPYLSLKSDKNKTLLLTGVSFASGGAGIFNGTDQALDQAIPLPKQVTDYTTVYEELVKQLGSSSAQHLSKSLFMIVIGSNDIFDYSGSSDRQKQSTPQNYVILMAATLKGQIKRLYNFGARKFVVAGLGTIGCIPSQRVKNETEECNEEANQWSALYNEELKSLLQELKAELKGVSYTYLDTYKVMQNITRNTAAHGFKEVKAACCGLGKLKADIPCVPISTYCSNRSDHLFWDMYHPTQATTRILVDTMFDGPSEYTFPINVRHLATI